jgi:DNA-binding SARP family transcriptional activator
LLQDAKLSGDIAYGRGFGHYPPLCRGEDYAPPAETAGLPDKVEMATEGTPHPDRLSANRPGPGPGGLRIWMLGGFWVSVGSKMAIERSAWRLRKAASLVKVLALAPGYRLHLEQAMDLLWPELGRSAAANNLRQALHVARKTLDPDPKSAFRYLSSKDESLAICPEGNLWVDADVFEEAASTARRSRDPAAYRAALELYAGELLPEDRYEEWAEGRRQGLGQLHLALLVELAGLYEEREEYSRGIEVSRRVLSEEITREEAHTSLMRLYALSGRRQESILQYERLRKSLSQTFGAEPCLSQVYLLGVPPRPTAAVKDSFPAGGPSRCG